MNVETHMNIHKYVIPASIAATLHVALLWLIPEGSPNPPPPVIEVPILPPLPRPPEEILPPEEKDKTAEPVKALAGGPARPVLEEIPPVAKAEFELPIKPPANVPVTTTLTEIPKFDGTGGMGPDGPGMTSGVLFPGDLDRVPRAKVQVPPDYPYAMKHVGASGTVVVEFDVDVTGRVVRAEATRYTDHEFVEPAVRAVRKWRFEPGRRNGRAVPFRMSIPIEFGIEPGA